MGDSLPSTDDILRGEKVRLGASLRSDIDFTMEPDEDPWFWRMLASGPLYPMELETKRELLQQFLEADDGFFFSIRTVDEDRFVGFINVRDIEWNHRTGVMGLGITSKEDRGKGYGTEAVEIVLRYAFDELNLHRVGLEVFEYNEAAIAVYERLGFVREGAIREALHRDGRRFDIYRYGLLRHEWVERSARDG